MNTLQFSERLVILFVFFLMTACSHFMPVPPQQALQMRVDQLWQARKARDMETIYKLTDAKYREAVSKDDFLKKPGMNVIHYEIREITIDGQTGLAKTTFETQRAGLKMRANMNELWVLEKGRWYLNLSEMQKKGPFGKWGS